MHLITLSRAHKCGTECFIIFTRLGKRRRDVNATHHPVTFSYSRTWRHQRRFRSLKARGLGAMFWIFRSCSRDCIPRAIDDSSPNYRSAHGPTKLKGVEIFCDQKSAQTLGAFVAVTIAAPSNAWHLLIPDTAGPSQEHILVFMWISAE